MKQKTLTTAIRTILQIVTITGKRRTIEPLCSIKKGFINGGSIERLFRWACQLTISSQQPRQQF